MTALDTDVLIQLLAGATPAERERAQTAVVKASQRGPLVISPIVFAELAAHPLATVEERDRFLADLRISVQWEMPEAVWQIAARAYAEYTARRRQAGAGHPRRVIADFLIGAHAAHVGRLATFDGDFFARTFPELVLV